MRNLQRCAVLLLFAQVCPAQDRRRIDPSGLPGTLVVAGGGTLPETIVDAFVAAAGGKAARIVVVPTAAKRADRGDAGEDSFTAVFSGQDVAELCVLHATDPSSSDDESFCAPLRTATGVWFTGGDQRRIATAYRGTRFERELKGVLARGGAIGGTSAGAAIQSGVMITGGAKEPALDTGFDLLPGAIIDQHFTKRQRQGRLRAAVAAHPDRYGIGLDEGTALLVKGRRIRVMGKGSAHLFLAAWPPRPAVETAHGGGSVLDLVALQRAARDRSSAAFPAADPPAPMVAKGAVMMVGGGRLTDEILERFIALAGGPRETIVVVPTAAGSRRPPRVRVVAALQRVGAENVHVFHAGHPREVESAKNLDRLARAKGLWFGGGRQWRLVDAYGGTVALKMFREVLERGGVIGGSSAGTSIQPEYMVRGNPLGNRDMMALGYERGFGFLPGVAADQHFSQRNRFRDLAGVVKRFPQLVGLGIDESTAVVVQGALMEVLGAGRVAIYDRRLGAPLADGKPPLSLGAGSRFDLRAGKAVR